VPHKVYHLLQDHEEGERKQGGEVASILSLHLNCKRFACLRRWRGTSCSYNPSQCVEKSFFPLEKTHLGTAASLESFVRVNLISRSSSGALEDRQQYLGGSGD